MNERVSQRRELRPPPRGVVAAIVGCAALGAWVLVGRQPGLNAPLVALAVALVVAWANEWRPTAHQIVFGLLSLAMAATAAVTSTEYLIALNLVSALVAASLAVASGKDGLGIALGLVAVARRSPASTAWLASGARHSARSERNGWIGRAARGMAIGAALVIVFGGLFVSSDAAFARIASQLLVPEVRLGLIPARSFVFGFIALFGAALVSFAPRFALEGSPVDSLGRWRRERRNEPQGRSLRLSRLEWIVALVMLNSLFACFVAIQLAVLFGGRTHVLETTGLTYAQYARSGYFELLAVATLTLFVLAGLGWWARVESARDLWTLRILAGLLCLLTLIVLASAMKRLSLYEEVYGLTRLRVAVHASLWWLAGLFGLLIAAGTMRRPLWRARAVAVYACVGLLTFTLLRPDALIANRNVDRYAETGMIDLAYISGLSADAVPSLARLPEPLRSCALGPVAERLREGDSALSFNLGRNTARRFLADATLRTEVIDDCDYYLGD